MMHLRLPSLVCLLALLPAAAGAAPATGLVAHYRFETLAGGTVRDEAGAGNDLRAQGSVTLEPGKVGQAARLSREGYLQAPKSASLEPGGELTLEAWIRPAAPAPSGMRILDRQTIGGNDGFMLDTYPEHHLRLIMGPGQLRSSEPIPVGEWTHVAATYSATFGEMRLYQNGRIVAEGFAGGKLRPSEHPLNVGASQGGGDRFQGLMDEVRIYARALAPEEIQAHFEGREIPPPAHAAGNTEPLPVVVQKDTLQVDYAALCARNDLVYLQPALYPYEAMHLGNGNLCATLWNAGGLTWQLNNGSYRIGNEPLSSGKVTLSTPALCRERPAHFEQRLRLWDGVVTTRAEGAEATSFVAEGEDCLVVRVREEGSGPRVLRLHLWPSRGGAHFSQGTDFVALTEHTEQKESFLATDMALLVKVDGAQVTAGREDERTLTLTLNGMASEYTVYVANPLLRGSEEAALRAAQAMVARAQAKGYARLLEERKAYWHRFWPRSFLHLTSANGEAELLENLWYLFHYDMGSMSRGTLCPKFNGGNWLVYDDTRHWGGGYWHQNTRELFWPLYASGHVELTEPFFDLYRRAMASARGNGRIGLKTDGFYIPEWIPVDGGKVGAPKDFTRPGYTAFIFTIGLEVALQAWWRYEFTGDERFLRETTYPLLKGSLDFYLNYAKKGPDGKYHIEPADAQESYWLVKDPAQDLAALRWAIPVALRASEKLGVDAEMRPRWRDLLENLAPFPCDPARNLLLEAELKPTDERHNWENVANYAVYPFGVFGVGLPEYERAKSTFLQRPIQGMGNGWEPAAVAAARLGLADEAASLTLAHAAANVRSNNGGWYSPTTAVFVNSVPDSPYYDAPGVSAQGLQEMLLQSHADVIRLAPAWPEKWQAHFSLRARAGFVVTAQVHAGQVRYALVHSEWGGRCRLANPWKEMAVVTCAGKPVLRSDKPLLEFATTKGGLYRVERAAQPVAAMPFARLAPAAAAGPKWIGRRLPPWPNWSTSLYLGIDAEGRTPQRAVMQRNAEGFTRRLAEATAGLDDLSTGKAMASVSREKGDPLPAPVLTDGRPEATVEVANGQSLLLDLGAPREVAALAFSRDRSGLYVDFPVMGFVVEASLDGAAWSTLLDRAKNRAAPAGQVERWMPTQVRYLRLRVSGQYNGAVRLDEVTVFGK